MKIPNIKYNKYYKINRTNLVKLNVSIYKICAISIILLN